LRVRVARSLGERRALEPVMLDGAVELRRVGGGASGRGDGRAIGALEGFRWPGIGAAGEREAKRGHDAAVSTTDCAPARQR
jgi:hypothetical protein